jgi:small subunit ribosomal protein S1
MKNKNRHNTQNLFDTKKLKNKFDDDDDFDFDDDESSLAKNKAAKELEELLREESASSSHKSLNVGNKVKCELVAFAGEEVFFSILSHSGRPRDGFIPKKELLNAQGLFEGKVGDKLELYISRTKGPMITLSSSPLAKSEAEGLLDAYKSALPIEGKITELCNGGVRVAIEGKSAFCPISQIDIVRVENAESYVGQKLKFLITQLSEGGRNIIVSRRKLLQGEKQLSEKIFIQEKREGDVVEGKVKKIEVFGAFVEIAPGIEGLVHISEMSWSRVSNPHEVVSIGQKVQAKIITSENKEGRLKISLSMKQVENEPWANITSLFKENQIVQGRVTRCVKFGAFVELSPGIEGLLPLSEMSHTKRVVRSDELFKEGESIVVMVKEIHPDSKRLLLSLKDAGSDPWSLVPHKFPIGSVVRGKVNRREPYGIFVELEEGITGLLPKSKATSNENGENPEFHYDKIKLSDIIAVQIAEINLEDRRISLAPPQDPDKDEWKEHLSNKQSKTPQSNSSQAKGSFASKLKNFTLKK